MECVSFLPKIINKINISKPALFTSAFKSASRHIATFLVTLAVIIVDQWNSVKPRGVT